MNKNNKELDLKGKEHLISLGVETPMIENGLTDDQKIESLT
mgnify:CR=1 FL=1